MPADLMTTVQASRSQNTVTTFSAGTPFVLPGGTPRRGLKLHILATVATSSTTNTVTWNLAVSYDGGSTFNTGLFTSLSYPLTTTSLPLEVAIPFDISPTSVANGTQIRLDCTTAGAGVPAVTYQADLELARP